MIAVMRDKPSSVLTRPSAVPPLRAVREAHGMSLRDAAQRSGIDPGHLSRVERGERQLSIDSLARLAEVLGLVELVRLLAPYRDREAS
jgi:transcriptional regulator with XRE-family HTH domain